MSAADGIRIELELPPLEDDALEVTLLDRTVTVSGLGFRSELELPASADAERLTATLRNHSLELHAPASAPRPRRIPVRRPTRLSGSACPD